MKRKNTALKLFNGRSQGHKYPRHHVYVAAKSMAEAARLVSMAFFDGRDNLVSVHEINIYYSKGSWGNKMDGIEPLEPCVYLCDETKFENKPFRVI
jgi:hypothetical protein